MKPLSPRYTSMKFGWILALATIAIGTYFLIAGAGVPGQVTPIYFTPDAWSYYNDGLIFRPPIYPLLLNGMAIIFGSLHKWVIGFIQVIIWGLASAAIWRIAVPRYGHWGIVLAIIFALLPPLVMWSAATSTEAISIPLVIFSALFLLQWLSHKKNRDLWVFAFSLIIMLLTKPAFIYVFIATVITAIPLLANRGRRKSGFKLLSVGILAISLTGLYSTYVYWQSGVFIPSLISVNNKYYMTRESGVLDISLHPDSTVRKMIADSIPDIRVGSPCKKRLAIWKEIHLFCPLDDSLAYHNIPILQIFKISRSNITKQQLPYQTLNQMITRSIDAHKTQYYEYILNNAYQSLFKHPIISGGYDFPDLNLQPPLQHRFGELQVKMGLTLATATVFLLGVLVALLCKPKKLASRTFLLWMVLCCLGNLGTVILGAPYDYSRLFVVSVPLVFLIVAAVGHSLSRRINKQYCQN